MTTITFPAVYRDGVLRPQTKLDLPEGAAVEVQVTVEPRQQPAPATPLDAQSLLHHAGAFQFDSGEMDRLLADIVRLRALDLEDRA